jgi:flagellar basal-body rod modification protein FlgD
MISETTPVNAPAYAPTASAQASKNLSADFDQFLTMLVTQLQNQDPLSPLDTNEFTAQLVQFASVEQQIQQNANLEQLISLERQGLSAMMTSFLGQSVEIPGNQLPLQGGAAAGSYVLASDAASVTLAMKDASGKVVATLPGETTAGRHDFKWDGESASGKTLPDGLYTVEVKALDKAGKPVPVQTSVQGRVTGLGYENGETLLLIDNAWVGADEIIALRAAPDRDDE